MSNSLQPHGLQHAWLLCTSLSPGVCSSSFPYPGLKTHSQSCSLGLGFTVSLSPQRMTFCHSYPYSKTLHGPTLAIIWACLLSLERGRKFAWFSVSAHHWHCRPFPTWLHCCFPDRIVTPGFPVLSGFQSTQSDWGHTVCFPCTHLV